MSLGHKSEMERLNRLRVDLKHHDITIAESEIEKARVNTTNFFEENTPIIFGMDFDKISMTDSVQYVPAREYLNQATALMEQERFGEALNKIAIAFDMIIDDFRQRKVSGSRKSPFHFEPASTNHHISEDIKRFVNDSIKPLKRPLEIISLGLDYRQYIIFTRWAPEATRIISGQYIEYEPPSNRTLAHCQFCYDFVIDSAIRIQDFEIEGV